MRYLLLLALAVSMLSGCSTTSQPAPDDGVSADTKNRNWKQRQAALSSMPSWTLLGRASVTYRGDNWPFGIDWQQPASNRYTMQIKHPLTQTTVADVVKTTNSVSLTANGRQYQDTSAERLIEKHLKVRIPVEGMQSWVRGIAAPGYAVSGLQLDAFGRPLALQQAGWNIKYGDYPGRNVDALPGLVQVSRTVPQPVQVKMRIRKWGR